MSEYCPSCMAENADGASRCSVCGGDMRLQNRQHQLPVMTILEGRYLLGKVLGEGGFGITYIGIDLRLEERVAIKEFYPAGSVARYATHSTEVEATSEEGEELLGREMEKFLAEARTMSRFSGESNIVHVKDFFYENSTAYIVMEYVDGETMQQRLKENGPEKDFNKLLDMLRPMMKDLDDVHKTGLIHRDISPSNLMMDKSGRVKLLDFGTARETNEDGEKSLSVVLKPGFAPEEQYRRRGKQGPWTDVYALCATMYKLCTGVTPEVSVDRLSDDALEAPSKLGVKINPQQEAVLARGLAVHQEDRIQSVAELLEELDKAAAGSDAAQEKHGAQPKAEEKKKPEHPGKERAEGEKAEKKNKHILPIAISAVIAAIAIFLVATKIVIPYCKYNTAVKLTENGQYAKAYEDFIAISDYKDSAEKAESISAQYLREKLESVEVGDTIYFGTYEQDNDTSNGAEYIEWQVLAKEDNKLLVISKYGLDRQHYNTSDTLTTGTEATWESCNLRTWLNETFLNDAFSAEEQAAIVETKVTGENNPRYDTDPGNETTDKIFLLSIDEAEKYFSSDDARACVPTDYAIAQGIKTNDSYKTASGESTCRWWLRSPGFNRSFAASVTNDGSFSYYGDGVRFGINAVRPALWINQEG